MKIDEHISKKPNQLHEAKMNVGEMPESVNKNLNKENVINQKLNLNDFKENEQSFENFLKEFALTQSNIQNGELKITELMEEILSEDDKSIAHNITRKRVNMIKKVNCFFVFFKFLYMMGFTENLHLSKLHFPCVSVSLQK
jgi:hypothetical protein